MDKPLKVRLKEEMKKRGVRTPALSIQTGIPQDRIYAWYRDGSNPKTEDRAILERWISGEMVEVFEDSSNGRTKPQESLNSEFLDIMRDRLKDMHERVRELKEDKEWLKKNLEFSLTALMVGNKSILAHVATILEKDDEREAGGNKKKEQALKDDSGRRIGDKLSGFGKMDMPQSS